MGYIHENDVIIIPRAENIPLGSRDTFAMTARLFVNTRYLWGGCSWNGIDCSGLTYIAAKMNGIIIPRDSLPQSQLGINIDLRNAVAGDQLFFGPDARKARVTHTGIYLGNGNFIHSTIGGVDITNIYTSSYYRNRLMFAKRLPFR
jgi:cell wall-associated NlpC family hydrolase